MDALVSRSLTVGPMWKRINKITHCYLGGGFVVWSCCVEAKIAHIWRRDADLPLEVWNVDGDAWFRVEGSGCRV